MSPLNLVWVTSLPQEKKSVFVLVCNRKRGRRGDRDQLRLYCADSLVWNTEGKHTAQVCAQWSQRGEASIQKLSRGTGNCNILALFDCLGFSPTVPADPDPTFYWPFVVLVLFILTYSFKYVLQSARSILSCKSTTSITFLLCSPHRG